jgi:hypothetical protein
MRLHLILLGLGCAVAQEEISLDVTGVGTVVVAADEEPADAVDAWLGKARAAGHDIGTAGIATIMQNLCQRKKCTRNVEPVSVDIEGVGTVVVAPGEEPADAVDAWLGRALAAGHNIGIDGLTQIMQNLCSRKRCTKNLAPVTLDVEGVGTIEVGLGQEPADAVSAWLEKTVAAGHNIDAGGISTIMKNLCARKVCTKQLPPQPPPPPQQPQQQQQQEEELAVEEKESSAEQINDDEYIDLDLLEDE